MSVILSKYRKNTYVPTAILAAMVCLFLLPSPANAQVDWLVGNSVLALLAGTLNFVRATIVSLIGLMGSGVDSVLKFGIADSPVVRQSWEVIRNFANMLFIIALIIMAFGTIFNIQGYDVRNLIARFLIAALLINFSLVIGSILIDWTQSLSNIFLSAIGDVGARIAQGVGIADLFKQAVAQTYTVDNRLWTETITVFINILLLSIVLFSLAVLLVLSMVRIPILWALLIVSPIAWMAYILPSTANISRRWWKEFIGWNIFLPIYLFFIYFGTFFLANQQQIISGISSQPLAGGLGTTFQQLFFFVLVAIFLIGGAKVAMGMSSAAGAGGVAAGIWARGKATARFSTLGLAGYGWRASGVPGAYKEIKEHIQKEGLAGTPLESLPLVGRYRGQRGLEERQAKIAGFFGIPGVADKQLGSKIEAETKMIKNKGWFQNREKLEDLMLNGGREQKIAATNLMREFHRELTGDEILTANELYGKGSVLGNKFLASINYRKLSKQDRDRLHGELGDNKQLIEKLTDVQLERNEVSDPREFQRILSIYTSEGDVVDAVKKTKDFRDKLSRQDRLDMFNSFTGKNFGRAAQRELAQLMAEKGDFDGNTLRGLVRQGGLYDTDYERDRLLNAAKEKRLVTTLRIRKELSETENMRLLPPDKAYPDFFKEQVSRLSNEAILKLHNDEYTDDFMTEVKSILQRSPKRIRGLINNKEYVEEKRRKFEALFDDIRAGLGTNPEELRKKGRRRGRSI